MTMKQLTKSEMILMNFLNFDGSSTDYIQPDN